MPILWSEPSLKKIAHLKSFGGEVTLFYDHRRHSIYAHPKGFIHPKLVKLDLLEIEKLSHVLDEGWKYIVDTTEVIFANPLNLIYLRQIQYQKGFGGFHLIAPNPFIRLLQKLTSTYLGITSVHQNAKELDIILDIS